MPYIEVNNITKQFEDSIAINNISFTLEEGELVTLLGPSGCGKTTILKLIAGLLQPDFGRIIVDGVDVSTISTEDRNIGFVFQSYALFPHLTVAENIAFGLETRKWSKESKIERVKELLKLVDLQGFGKRYPRELSGGEKSRVALARAIAPNPNLLLLDEPLSALDVSLKDSLQKAIREIQQKIKITTLYVTHDQREAMEVSDKIIVLNEGQVIEVGTPQQLYLEPKRKFTAQFLGISNIFVGDFELKEKKSYIKLPFGTIELPTLKTKSKQKNLVAIYPEQITFSTRSLGNKNEFEGTLFEISFGGEMVQFKIKINDYLLEIHSTNKEEVSKFSIGEKLFISIPENSIRILEEE
ncbi:MAG: ABC transporter ATP-binding protein [Asgard group archaeon]|nr:ABC transporter ATP-binding protein [Asgard group archaeon]